MESEFIINTREEFWEELKILASNVAISSDSSSKILLKYISLGQSFLDSYLEKDDAMVRFALMFLDSETFRRNKAHLVSKLAKLFADQYIVPKRDVLASLILLCHGKTHPETFQILCDEPAFPKLISIIYYHRTLNDWLFRFSLDLLFEISRIRKLPPSYLALVDHNFLMYTMDLIETDANYIGKDEFSSSLLKIILVFNEQFMLKDPADSTVSDTPYSSASETSDYFQQQQSSLLPAKSAFSALSDNPLVDLIAVKRHKYPNFGHNLVLLFNRNRNHSLQLLILKLLHCIFTNNSTVDYFYLNDLYVIVDIFIRQLIDLSSDKDDLRNAYLRVLEPILHSEELKANQYKRDELYILLFGLASESHFAEVSSTTRRLAHRCISVDWICRNDSLPPNPADSPPADIVPPLPTPPPIGTSLKTNTNSSSAPDLPALATLSLNDGSEVNRKPGFDPSLNSTTQSPSANIAQIRARGPRRPPPPPPRSRGMSVCNRNLLDPADDLHPISSEPTGLSVHSAELFIQKRLRNASLSISPAVTPPRPRSVAPSMPSSRS
ncbi:hypothetical protein CANCADRAFT_1785 [Tortispora caseinolytica NRRL Y-17796]|uniref:SPIN90/Ldb17 leucine-rich domain-containing protein n=1 Tax=Tortispora caseinolytica NRRL Y-17796 TaxID=767744 RepID=A0A1E4TEC3_9ASCO|nr:hypothetical protein CANCADRAFT_1785 [Tortispora caseinolytica NRRL Y-17796]